MSTPKMSGALNNCGLHVFVPTITEQVEKLVADPEHANPHKAYYEALKDSFAEFYGFSKNEFNFKQFSELLKKYNDHERQIILGPVLREFMKKTMSEAEIGSEKTERFTEMKEDGRYELLQTEESFRYIGKALGIKVIEARQGLEDVDLGEVDSALGEIVMHHTGLPNSGHWELSNVPDKSAEERSRLTNITGILGNGCKEASQGGLKFLREHVNMTYKGFPEPFFQRLEKKVEQYSSELVSGSPSPIDQAFFDKLKAEERVIDQLAHTNPNGKTQEYKEELAKLFNKREEIQQQALAPRSASTQEEKDYEMALKLQAEEFEKAGFSFKP